MKERGRGEHKEGESKEMGGEKMMRRKKDGTMLVTAGFRGCTETPPPPQEIKKLNCLNSYKKGYI